MWTARWACGSRNWCRSDRGDRDDGTVKGEGMAVAEDVDGEFGRIGEGSKDREGHVGAFDGAVVDAGDDIADAEVGSGGLPQGEVGGAVEAKAHEATVG